jgi:hypothetical protein
VEQIVIKGYLERRAPDLSPRYGGYALVDETTGEVLYALADPRDLLEGRIDDLVQVHGTVVETGGDVPLLEVARVD